MYDMVTEDCRSLRAGFSMETFTLLWSTPHAKDSTWMTSVMFKSACAGPTRVNDPDTEYVGVGEGMLDGSGGVLGGETVFVGGGNVIGDSEGEGGVAACGDGDGTALGDGDGTALGDGDGGVVACGDGDGTALGGGDGGVAACGDGDGTAFGGGDGDVAACGDGDGTALGGGDG